MSEEMFIKILKNRAYTNKELKDELEECCKIAFNSSLILSVNPYENDLIKNDENDLHKSLKPNDEYFEVLDEF